MLLEYNIFIVINENYNNDSLYSYVLSVRHCVEHFMCVISLNLHNNLVKLGFREPGLREVQAQLEATEPEMLALEL